MYKYRNYILIILIFIVGALEAGYVYMQTVFTEKDYYYAALLDEIATLRAENQNLQAQLWWSKSYTVIADKAKEQGFTEKTAYYYLY